MRIADGIWGSEDDAGWDAGRRQKQDSLCGLQAAQNLAALLRRKHEDNGRERITVGCAGCDHGGLQYALHWHQGAGIEDVTVAMPSA